MSSKLRSATVFSLILLIAGCGPSAYTRTESQVSYVLSIHEQCISGLKITAADRSLYQFIFPSLKDVGFDQKTDQRRPSDNDIERLKPLFSKKLECERNLISNMTRISGLRGSERAELAKLISIVDSRARAIENAAAGLVLKEYSYGGYFTRYEGAMSSAKTSAERLEAQSSQQQQRPSTQVPTFKPYCPPSKYPIYGCGNTSSTPSSSNRSPPGSKDCTYKTGPYKWTKTIKGYTCPATDSSGGYFGTLVR